MPRITLLRDLPEATLIVKRPVVDGHVPHEASIEGRLVMHDYLPPSDRHTFEMFFPLTFDSADRLDAINQVMLGYPEHSLSDLWRRRRTRWHNINAAVGEIREALREMREHGSKMKLFTRRELEILLHLLTAGDE